MAPVVDIQNLTKTFGRVKAINDFSIEVNKGDVFAFLGSNGSGKTTTFRCLLGIYNHDSGTARIKGHEYTSEHSNDVGYLPEERGIYTKSTVNDVLDHFARLHGMGAKERAEKIDTYLERVGLAANKHQKVSQLSSGMQQKVQIGVAILHEPSVLILDEPFKGLDPLNRQLFLDIFEERRNQGATILYSTHVVDEVQRLANRVVMIKNGRRVLYGSIDEVRELYGTDSIRVSFDGYLPDAPKYFSARREHNFAELTPTEGTTSRDILRYLINETDITIREFTVDRPSLNTIFINEAKHTDDEV